MRLIITATLLATLLACAETPSAAAPPATPEPLSHISPVSTVGPPPTFVVTAPTARPTLTPRPQATRTPTPEPRFQRPTPAPPATLTVQQEDPTRTRAALAYAYCNGRYFGSAAQSRYNLTMTQLEAGSHALAEVEADVKLLCNGNFHNPRENLQRPTSTPLPTATPDPRREDATPAQRRQFVLDLLNSKRADAGLPPLARSVLPTAQEHAEYGRNHCAGGLWRLSGENLIHLYHRDGGGHQIWTLATGHDRCSNVIPEDFPTWQEAAASFVDTISARYDSPIRNPEFTAVVLGIAWTPAQRWFTAIFEAERAIFQGNARAAPTVGPGPTPPIQPQRLHLPEIENGRARVTATLDRESARADPRTLIARLYYAPLPEELTRYQIHRPIPVSPGNLIAVAIPVISADSDPDRDDADREDADRPPARTRESPGSRRLYPNIPECRSSRAWNQDEDVLGENVRCRGAWLTPYDLPRADPNPTTQSRPHLAVSEPVPGIPVSVPSLLARYLTIEPTPAGPLLQLSVQVQALQEAWGAGVYSVEVWGEIAGEPRLLAAGSAAYQPK